MSARGVRHVTIGIRRLTEWHHFLDIMEGGPDQVRTKLLTHYSGHGNVSVLLADTPHADNVTANLPQLNDLTTISLGTIVMVMLMQQYSQ